MTNELEKIIETDRIKVKLVSSEIIDMKDISKLLLAVFYYSNIYYGLYCDRKQLERIYYNRIIVPEDVINPKDFTGYMVIAVTDDITEKILIETTKNFKVYDIDKIKNFIKNSTTWMDMKNIYPEMISTEIVKIPDTNCCVVAVCTLDEQYYAAIYNTITMQGHVEYIFIRHSGKWEFKFNIIPNDLEWSIISDFFNKNNVFDLANINNKMRYGQWNWQTIDHIQYIPKSWVESVEKKRRKLHTK